MLFRYSNTIAVCFSLFLIQPTLTINTVCMNIDSFKTRDTGKSRHCYFLCKMYTLIWIPLCRCSVTRKQNGVWFWVNIYLFHHLKLDLFYALWSGDVSFPSTLYIVQYVNNCPTYLWLVAIRTWLKYILDARGAHRKHVRFVFMFEPLKWYIVRSRFNTYNVWIVRLHIHAFFMYML